MKTTKISEQIKSLVIDLLKNVNGLKIEDYILNNCHILLDNTNDIVGTISYEKYDKLAIIRYFVFKRNIEYKDLRLLENSLED